MALLLNSAPASGGILRLAGVEAVTADREERAQPTFEQAAGRGGVVPHLADEGSQYAAGRESLAPESTFGEASAEGSAFQLEDEEQPLDQDQPLGPETVCLGEAARILRVSHDGVEKQAQRVACLGAKRGRDPRLAETPGIQQAGNRIGRFGSRECVQEKKRAWWRGAVPVAEIETDRAVRASRVGDQQPGFPSA